MLAQHHNPMKNTLHEVSPSPATLERLLKELTGEVPALVNGKSETIKTRHTLSSGIQVAFGWLEQHYANWGIATLCSASKATLGSK